MFSVNGHFIATCLYFNTTGEYVVKTLQPSSYKDIIADIRHFVYPLYGNKEYTLKMTSDDVYEDFEDTWTDDNGIIHTLDCKMHEIDVDSLQMAC